jgi:rubrerythrin
MPNEAALGWLATALEMERKGYRFYRDTLNQCENPAPREIFRMLMEDEIVHMDIIKRIFDTISGGEDWSGELGEFEQHRAARNLEDFFGELAGQQRDHKRACQDDLQAIELGLDFERRSVRYYQKRHGAATDPLERRFLELLIGEERTHEDLLLDTKIYLEDPEGWTRRTGDPMLDRE